MVDTVLRPRPGFTTFLQSDTNAGEDPLNYYNYQRLLRAQKVALLQEKRARAYVPGYRRPTAADSKSRQIFQLQRKSPAQNSTHPPAPRIKKVELHLPAECRETLPEPLSVHETESNTILSPLLPARESDSTTIRKDESREEPQLRPHAETERLPKPRQRLVKSATARQQRHTDIPTYPPRPKTVGGTTRGVHLLPLKGASVLEQHLELKEGGVHRHAVSEQGLMLEGKSLRSVGPTHQRLVTDGVHQLVDLEDSEATALKLPPAVDSSAADRDALAKAYLWGTSTQRAYDEVGWAEKLPPAVPPPSSTLEPRPDQVSYRLNLKRRHTAPAGWQSFGPEWDYVQTRVGNFVRGPQGVEFCSPHRQNQHLPGYTGCGRGEADGLHCGFVPVLVRSIKPRPTGISRRANIPGYTGHVHWTRTQPAHSDMPLPEPTTSARVHRAIPLEEELSPFQRNGVLSKMVTLVSPHNPFNRVEQ